MRQFTLLVILLLTGLFQVAFAQNRSISGRVTDRSTNQGLPGVTVLVKGTTIGTATNNDGGFVLNVPETATTLTFSFIGYTAIEQAIGNGNNINVALAPDSKQIGEVVITGALGIQRQAREVGYATAQLDSKEITQARPTNFVSGLAGKVSGLQIQTLNNGVNPVPRVTLRGTRSLTGSNDALIVIDGVISTPEVLGALNPDDIANTSILKGANAAALYGSQASNGALIITTKKGGNTSQVTFSHTSQFESISFLPKFQDGFGPGSPDWIYAAEKRGDVTPFAGDGQPDNGYLHQYQGFENQQYGPRFDGSLQPFGQTLADGSVQTLPYVARPNEKRDFFNTGYQTQNGVSFSGGDEKTKFFASYQNVHNNGIIPKDKYDRNNFRFNASREIGRLTAGFNISYSQQKIDATSNLDQSTSVYWNVFNTTVMAPLTSYKDYVNDKYSEPNYGYYNAYYYNPYFILDANRVTDKRNTVQGDINLSFKATDWLHFQYRIGTTAVNQASVTTQEKFSLDPNSPKQISSYPGFVRDLGSNLNRINSDLFATINKNFGIFSVQAILGNNVQQLDSRFNYVASTALATPGLFNLQNRVGNLVGADGRTQTRLYAFYADVTLGLKEMLYVHGSLRNDNTSLLEAGNRSFLYPGVDASFVFSEAIPALKDASFFDYGKIRGGIAKVSIVNLQNSTPGFGVYNTGGAYSLQSTYSPGSGFPFGGIFSNSADGTLVQTGLKPEDTRSIEAGIELSFFKHRLAGGATYYAAKSTNQTITTSVSGASGYQNLLLNAGEVHNNGIEADLNITPLRLENGLTVTLGGNFNYNVNKVISLPPGLPQLLLPGSGDTSGNAGLYAIPGQPFPVIQGTYYQRDSQNRVELTTTNSTDGADKTTYYVPVQAAGNKILGNTQPKYKYGFNAGVTYRGLTLSGQGEVRTGYYIYNAIGSDLDFTGGGVRSTSFDRQNFTYPNSAYLGADGNYAANTDGQHLTPGGSEFWANTPSWNRGIAENYVTPGTFFKIRELTLGYAIPAELLSKVGIVKGASLSIYGRNLYTWVPKSNIYTDPEFSATSATGNPNAIGINSFLQTPPTKFYGATLNVTL